MQCPKCKGDMVEKSYGGRIRIHRCEQCLGLYGHPETFARMKREWMADAVLDKGDPSLGRKYNKIEAVNCPQCGTRMETLTDEKQTHISYEKCPGCENVFFDAGEFTDWKHETLMDVFRGILAKIRD